MNAVINRRTRFLNLGLVDYKVAWDYQTKLFEEILAVKKANRDRADDEQHATDNFVIFCEHPHVFTLGKNGKQDNLLVQQEGLEAIKASYYHINRGGDITYHGPGQIVGYPVIDLENFFTDIHHYMRSLEEAVIQCLAEYGIMAGRIPGLTGVWLNTHDKMKARKICAFGVKTSRWVTLHGLALNVNTDLNYFKYIVPCGIQDKAVTSMKTELGTELKFSEVEEILKEKIAAQFGMEWA